MKNDFINMLILAISFLLLFTIAEIIYYLFKVNVEYTRKIVHIGTGCLSMLFPVLIQNHWLILCLCISFAIILLLSLKYNLLKSINSIDRKSVGSLAYPFAVYICFLAQTFLDERIIFYYLPLCILAICDPMAALLGKKWPIGPYIIFGAKKSLLGSIAFFICALILIFLIWNHLHEPALNIDQFIRIFIIAVIGTIAEALSRDGYDNVTIPLSTILGLYILMP